MSVISQIMVENYSSVVLIISNIF